MSPKKQYELNVAVDEPRGVGEFPGAEIDGVTVGELL